MAARWSAPLDGNHVDPPVLVELSENLVRLRTGADGWRICPASLVARVPGKLTLDRLM